MAPNTETVSWQACPNDDLLWAPFSGSAAVYHRPSGKTHFLNAASVYLVGTLLQKPVSTADVLSLMNLDTAGDDGSDDDELVATLERLEILGLVRRT